MTRGDYLKANGDVVNRMITAVREGLRAYLDDPAKTNAVMQQLNSTMDAQTFSDSAAAQKTLIEPDPSDKAALGMMTPQRWQTLCDQLVDLKVIDKAPEAVKCFKAPTP